MRVILALALFTLPAMAQDRIDIRCDSTHCMIEIGLLKALVEMARMNCGTNERR